MINPKSVRIGNTVLHHWEEHIIEAIDIFGVCVDNSGNRINIPFEDISGVPITNEWLVSKGFEKCVNGWWDRYEYYNLRLVDDKWDFKETGTSVPMKEGIEFTYQIENLYFCLTETEL